MSRQLAGCKRNRSSVPGRLSGFSVPRNVQSRHGTQTSSFSIHTGGYIVDIKWPEREADHSRFSSTDVINA